MLRRWPWLLLGFALLILIIMTIHTHDAAIHHPLVGEWVHATTAMRLNADGTGMKWLTRDPRATATLTWDIQPENQILLSTAALEWLDAEVIEGTWQIDHEELRIGHPGRAPQRWLRWQLVPQLSDQAHIKQALLAHEWHTPWVDDADTVITFAADGTFRQGCTNDLCAEKQGQWTHDGFRIVVQPAAGSATPSRSFDVTVYGTDQLILRMPDIPQPIYFRGRPRS